MATKKKRHLKKWVVVVLYIIVFCIISIIFWKIIGDFNLSNYDIKTNDENNKYEYDNNYKIVYKDGFYYDKLSPNVIKKITGITFPKEFDEKFTAISYDDLRYVRVKYYDFDKKERIDGKLIVNKLVAQDIVEIFYELYQNKYPIEKMVLVDEYNGDDELSMEDNNTSCFNYRIVENIDRLSWHAFGLAIDINPLYNPYVINGNIYPNNAQDYVNRNLDFDGKIDHNDLAYKVFIKYGWKWGGDFEFSKDYQHFYKEIMDDDVRERKD